MEKICLLWGQRYYVTGSLITKEIKDIFVFKNKLLPFLTEHSFYFVDEFVNTTLPIFNVNVRLTVWLTIIINFSLSLNEYFACIILMK